LLEVGAPLPRRTAVRQHRRHQGSTPASKSGHDRTPRRV